MWCTGLSYSMWDLPGSGIEPMSPVLASGFFSTEPPGKPSLCLLTVCCWCFSLAFFILLAKSLGYLAASSLYFLVQFLWSSTSTFVLQNTWSNRTMNLECSGPRFLTFFVQGLSYNILADFIFLGEIEKFSSSSSFGPQAMRHSSIRESKTILSPLFFLTMT